MGQGGGQGELEGGGLHPKTTRLQLGAYRGSPRSGSSTQSVAGGAAAAWALLIKTFILHFIVVCTELPKACAGPGLGQRGAGGPALAPGASDVGVTQTLGRSVLRPFEVGGLKHSFFTSCPKGWTPPGGGGRGLESGTEPLSGWGEVVAKGGPNPAPPPPGSGELGLSVRGAAGPGAQEPRKEGAGPRAMGRRGRRAGGAPRAAPPQPEWGSVPSPSRARRRRGEQRAQP